MNKYDKLMREIVDFLDGTWLAEAKYSRLPDKGPIAGNSHEEIEQVENHIGKKLPDALRAWYSVAGKIPPYLNDHDATYSSNDLKRAQETARILVEEENCRLEMTEQVIPFSSRLDQALLYVDTRKGNSEDPIVSLLVEWETHPKQVDVTFSIHIREKWLSWLDFPKQSQEIRNEMSAWRDKGYDDWLTRKRLIDQLKNEVSKSRAKLIEKVHEEDISRNEITGPKAFQERWVSEFSTSEIWKKLQTEGLRFPYNWTTAPQVNSKS